MDDFVTIATHYSMAEAEPERLALDAAGIPTRAIDSSPLPGMTYGIKLEVAAEDAARAEAVLEALRNEAHPPEPDPIQDDDGVSFTCQECQAEIWFPSDRRGHVEVCPECGAHVDVPEQPASI